MVREGFMEKVGRGQVNGRWSGKWGEVQNCRQRTYKPKKRAAERTEKLGNLRKSLVHLSDSPNNRGSEIPNSFAPNSRFGAGSLVCQISSVELFPLFLYLYTETIVEHDSDKLHSPAKIPCRYVFYFLIITN